MVEESTTSEAMGLGLLVGKFPWFSTVMASLDVWEIDRGMDFVMFDTWWICLIDKHEVYRLALSGGLLYLQQVGEGMLEFFSVPALSCTYFLSSSISGFPLIY